MEEVRFEAVACMSAVQNPARQCFSARLVLPFVRLLQGYPAFPRELLAKLEAVDPDQRLPVTTVHERKPFADTGSIDGPGPWTNISDDGVHPTDAGQAVQATQIVNTMKSACLGQPGSSNCCAP
jgi:hypothetical protein